MQHLTTVKILNGVNIFCINCASTLDTPLRNFLSSVLAKKQLFFQDNWEWIVLWYGWPTKVVSPYFQPGPLSKILIIANLRHAASRIWTCAEAEFRLCWMKLGAHPNNIWAQAIIMRPVTVKSTLLLFLLIQKVLEKNLLLKTEEFFVANFTPKFRSPNKWHFVKHFEKALEESLMLDNQRHYLLNLTELTCVTKWCLDFCFAYL